jgi:hypothetical protein
MLNTSTDFKASIDAPSRSVQGILEIFLNEVVATATALSGTNASHVTHGAFRTTDFTTINSIVLPKLTGWIGANVSDAQGNISPETITVSYSDGIYAGNVWVIGRRGNYPVDFTLEIQDNGVWETVATVTGNTRWDWFTKIPSAGVADAARLTVSKISTANEKLQVLSCGVVHKLLIAERDLATVSLLEEGSTEDKNPVGKVTANELNIELSNENGWFTSTNEGPLSGLIKPGLKVKMHCGVKLSTGEYECVSWGTQYVVDWDAPSDLISAKILCYDRLAKLLEKPLPNKLPLRKVTIADAFEYVFSSIGLASTEYVIDASLTRVLDIFWIPPGKVKDILDELAVAGLCNVFVTRDNKIRVIDLLPSSTSVDTITESAEIISFRNPQNFNSVYPVVEIKYFPPRPSPIEEIAKLEDLPIPNGTVILDDVVFQTPICTLEDIDLGDASTYVKSVNYGAQALRLSVFNPNLSEETIEVIIRGRIVESTSSIVTREDAVLSVQWPDKALTIESEYIQSSSFANNYADALLDLAKDSKAFYQVSTIGDFSYELFDQLTIAQGDSIKTSTDLSGIIVRQQLFYDGGLESELLLRKPLV